MGASTRVEAPSARSERRCGVVGVEMGERDGVDLLDQLCTHRIRDAAQHPNTIAERRVGEDPHAVELEQRCRVADPGDGKAWSRWLLHFVGSGGRREGRTGV